MPAKKNDKNDNSDAADIFAPVAPNADPAEAANTPAELFAANADGAPTPTEGALNDAFDQAVKTGADQPGGAGIDFAELSRRQAERKAADPTLGDPADPATADAMRNVPIDDAGNAVTGGFFIDLTKDDGDMLIAASTRAVVSCTAAEPVISSAGNPMLNVRVKIERVITAPDMAKAVYYKNRSVRDRLMFIPPNPTTGSRGTLWRAKLAIEAFGVEYQPRAFKTQADFMTWLKEIADAMIGSVAEVTIGIDDGTSGGTKAPQIDPATNEPYPPKNTIARYAKYQAQATRSINDEDLPF